MESWLITRYLLARFQQLSALSSGFRKAKPVRVLRLWGAIARRNLREVGQCLAKRWSRCVHISQGIWLTRKLKVSMPARMAILRQVVSLGTPGVETQADRG